MSTGLVKELRKRLGDERYSVPAFSIQALDNMATDALLEVRQGRLRTSVINGTAAAVELNLDLLSGPNDTLGGLVQTLQASYKKQYSVVAVEGMRAGHPSFDLELVQNLDIGRTPATLRTRRFGDSELEQYLRSGARRHNPTYQLETLPIAEHDMVLSLAHVEALRALASDASRRRGLEASASDLMDLAGSIEAAYYQDVRRLAKALVPVRTDDDGVREGDVIVGETSRKSLRTGFKAPAYASLQPQPPLLYQVDDRDVYDFSVEVRWRRTRHDNVYTLELWRDVRPEVRRTRDVDVYPTTSKRVWRSLDRNDRVPEGYGVVDLAGELIDSFVDGYIVPSADCGLGDTSLALTPETDYYYRLYLVDKNGQWVASEVVRTRTKAARALMTRPAPLSAAAGSRAGGDTITMTGSGFSSAGPVSVMIGDKPAANVTPASDTSLTFDTPAAHAFIAEQQNVVLISRNGLRDVLPLGWRYTS